MISKPSSKEILVESLRELLETRSFEKITVQDIVDNCHMTRTTFYRHFRDKFDLIDWYYMQMIHSFNASKQIPGSDVSWVDVSRNVIEFFKRNAAFFKAVLEYEGQNSFEDFWYDYVRDYCLETIRQHNKTDEIATEVLLAVDFHVGGNTKVLLDWIRRDCAESSDVILDILYACIPRPLEKYFKD